MALGTMTYTGKAGPGLAPSAIVLTNVSFLAIDESGQTVTVNCTQGNLCLSLYEITTFTYTIASHTATITLS